MKGPSAAPDVLGQEVEGWIPKFGEAGFWNAQLKNVAPKSVNECAENNENNRRISVRNYPGEYGVAVGNRFEGHRG